MLILRHLFASGRQGRDVNCFSDHIPPLAFVASAALILSSCGGANVDVEFGEVDGSVAPVTESAADAPTEPARDVAASVSIDEEIDKLVDDAAVPSIGWATVSNGSVTAGASGLADVAEQRRALPTTAYALGSVSKPVLAAVVMTMVEDGLLDLDADINGLIDLQIDNPLVGDDVITLRRLMTHTSGIIDNDVVYESQYRFNGDDHLPLADFLVAYLTPDGEFFDPVQNFTADDEYAYSNVGAGLVGHVVEEVTGMPLEQVAEQRVFTPLAMNDTGWRLASFDDVEEVATPYASRVDGVEAMGHVGFPTYPDGGLRSSPADLARFAGMIAGGGMFDGARVLEPHSVTTMLEGHLFWSERGVFAQHDGFDPGAQAEILVDPANGFGAVMMTNSDAAAASAALGMARTELIVASGYDPSDADVGESSLAVQLDELATNMSGDVAVAIVSEGDARLAATGDLSASSLVPLPAVTSTMLGVIFSQLVDEGVLRLDQLVADFVAVDLVAGLAPSITIQQLVDHTAGLALPVANLGTDATIDELLASVIDIGAAGDSAVGEFSITHNLVAIKVLEAVTGVGAADLFATRLFEPAGMVDSRLVLDADDLTGVIEGTLPGAAGEAVATSEFGEGVSLAGTVAVSPADLVSFIQAIYDGRLFGADSDALERMTPMAGSGEWGLGILDLTEFAGSATSAALGDIAGYRSFVAWTVDGELIVTIVANSEFVDVEALAELVID